MSIVKNIEVVCEGKSIDDALANGFKEAAKTIKNIKQIVGYRVNAKLSFVIEH